jgi:hypothetical protein
VAKQLQYRRIERRRSTPRKIRREREEPTTSTSKTPLGQTSRETTLRSWEKKTSRERGPNLARHAPTMRNRPSPEQPPPTQLHRPTRACIHRQNVEKPAIVTALIHLDNVGDIPICAGQIHVSVISSAPYRSGKGWTYVTYRPSVTCTMHLRVNQWPHGTHINMTLLLKSR